MKRLSFVFLGLALLTAPLAATATPKIQQWTLKNGARIFFVESHQLPMVQFSLAFNAGSARDPENEPGLALLANHLLKEGTFQKNAGDIARQFESVGAEFDTDIDRDMATVSLRSLSDPDKLASATSLFAEIVQQPSFPESSLARERQRLLVGLKSKKESPGDTASDLFFKLTYGKHAYAHAPEGDEAHLAGIQRTDLVAFHKQYYVGRNAVLAIMGDIDKSDAKRLAKQLVGTLPEGSVAAPIPPVIDKPKGETRFVKFNSKQSHILVGLPGMDRQDPDYYSLYLGNYILGGGGLVSRLSDEIREKNGLAYSVYSYFWPMARRGPFIMGLQTENRHRDRALRLMNKVLDDFIKNGPTPEELAAAKSHITGGFPLRIDTSKKLVGYMTVIGFYHLPLTFLDDYPKRIEALTAEQVRDAFARRIRPEAMTTVVVGGPSK